MIADMDPHLEHSVYRSPCVSISPYHPDPAACMPPITPTKRKSFRLLPTKDTGSCLRVHQRSGDWRSAEASSAQGLSAPQWPMPISSPRIADLELEKPALS